MGLAALREVTTWQRYRKNGLDDQQIIEAMLKRKDALAKTNATNDKINARSDKYRLAANRTGGDWVKGATEIGVSIPFYAYGAGGTTMAARAGEQAVRGAGVSALGRADSSKERL